MTRGYDLERLRAVRAKRVFRMMHRDHRGTPLAAVLALVVSISCDELLALVDLRADGLVRIGAPSGVAHDDNLAAGRALSGAIRGGVPEASLRWQFEAMFLHYRLDRCVTRSKLE
ncbi:MAG: hypothetical protein OYH76_13280 [Defluviicoccus sp.]|nr:hypothetical protein [Defluviicoccus sp.]MDE0276861.1 hypothetical protein [Defluviicoccus sp.]